MKTFLMAWVPLPLFIVLAGCQSEVEEAVKHELIDAESAQFRDVAQCSGDTQVFRGAVNAKNRMGAYTGFDPFFYDGVSVTFAGSPDFTKMMNRCYKAVATPKESPTTSETPASESAEGTNWVTSEDVNPVDDSKTRRATLLADEGASSMHESVSLTIRCQSNRTELYVNWNDYLGDDSGDVYEEWKKITIRIGSQEARTERWGISTDSEATFAPSSPVALIQKMAKVDRLVLQTTPYNESPVTAVFNLKGIEKAVSPIAEGCGWKL
ncbi:MAG: type VI secretion system-associated protein TagO [Sphingomonas sp.]|uniref:type VI secretion system-associated protein TagO n=1 Tax=Sphingomonas sp. TaxID=28214 RepID=UPI002275168C|nr:type VI secretion system-associated protein TagO [Sphingomonas sp.]MCX8474261.1 type VI secretion system-associated protein TagO [Sphingomonas sp.]